MMVVWRASSLQLYKDELNAHTIPLMPVHYATCDGCQHFPIVGLRFQCTVCKDTDFCERCHIEHPLDHPLIQYRVASSVTPTIVSSLTTEVKVEGNEKQPTKVEVKPLESHFASSVTPVDGAHVIWRNQRGASVASLAKVKVEGNEKQPAKIEIKPLTQASTASASCKDNTTTSQPGWSSLDAKRPAEADRNDNSTTGSAGSADNTSVSSKEQDAKDPIMNKTEARSYLTDRNAVCRIAKSDLLLHTLIAKAELTIEELEDYDVRYDLKATRYHYSACIDAPCGLFNRI